MKTATLFSEILMILLPLIGSFLGLFTLNNNLRIIFSTGATCISFLIALSVFFTFNHNICYDLFKWISIGSLDVSWSICIDRVSSIMCLVVTLVSSAVHVYSIGYMSNDQNRGRFFSYLSLFTFFMLAMVTSKNFLQLFFGWEGVGLCSYLLIGFWFEKYSANEAAIKAFIVNRFADVFFVLALVLIFWSFNTLDIKDVSMLFMQGNFIKIIPLMQLKTIDVICLLILIGCMGKSAQIGLHVWLPDAMEGPTPISALIHAATMVAAGVFMIAKSSFLFEGSELARNFCLAVGTITCISCALIGLAQSDIKKVIAYSTCSQLGYMFMACGSSSYNIAIFHLTMHAFFKALLFLCAGNVIHSFHGEQNIFKMGGNCFKKMKLTYIMFWIGSLALSGFFPLSGFFSKDLIIEGLYHEHFMISFSIGLLTAFITSFYSFKLIILIFHKPSHIIKKDVHESSLIMNIPLLILSILSIISGFIYHNKIIDYKFWMESLIATSPHSELSFSIISQVVSLSGALTAYIIYGVIFKVQSQNFLFTTFRRRLYIDELYHFVFCVPYGYISVFFVRALEKGVDFMLPGLMTASSYYTGKLVLITHSGNIKLQQSFVFVACIIGVAFVYFLSF